MTVASFLKLVEIQTKVASVIPFLLGTVFALHRYHSFNLKNFLLMFVSLLTFDMVTTAINNYCDYKRANKTHGYNYESHNAIVRDNLQESTVIITIITLLSIATLVGILLYLNTNLIVLIVGIVSFLAGIFYSFGPLPMNRMPVGEIVSGFFMGFVIVFLAVYIHIFDKGIVELVYSSGLVQLTFNLKELIYIFLISIPAVTGIANIMLANNTCDIEDDIENRRFTLPIYIGREKALQLFKLLYYISYLDLLLLVILKVLPLTSLVVLLTYFLVSENIKRFYQKQSKKDTFVFAVQNFVSTNLAHILGLVLGFLL